MPWPFVNMLVLDANILVRLLTNDDPAQAQRVQDALDAELTARRECLVGQIVLCELVWVSIGCMATRCFNVSKPWPVFWVLRVCGLRLCPPFWPPLKAGNAMAGTGQTT